MARVGAGAPGWHVIPLVEAGWSIPLGPCSCIGAVLICKYNNLFRLSLSDFRELHCPKSQCCPLKRWSDCHFMGLNSSVVQGITVVLGQVSQFNHGSTSCSFQSACQAYSQQAPAIPQRTSHRCTRQPLPDRTLTPDQSAAQQAQAVLRDQPSDQGETEVGFEKPGRCYSAFCSLAICTRSKIPA